MTAYLRLKKQALSLAGARLVVTRGPDRGRSLLLAKDEVNVGVAPSNDLVVTDETVSRHHLSLRVLAGGYLASDLESTNGTFLLGRRIKSAFVEPGDTLEVGTSRIRLEAVADPIELPLSDSPSFGGLVGRSADSRRLFALLELVARQDVTVLLMGETGTGKDLTARSIHEASPRASKPFAVIDCSAIPGNLLEAELFGFEKGAFTGADRRREGTLLQANGGTLFLDEISHLSYEMQPKLLRALENREVRPLGASGPLAFDVRVVAASSSDLRLDVNRGVFREDLFYRLNVVSIRLPPLRERAEDIPVLANHFYRELTGDRAAELPAAKLEPLLPRSWPGNVRELRNTIERLVVLADLEQPEADLARFLAHEWPGNPIGSGAPALAPLAVSSLLEASRDFERRSILAALTVAGGNKTRAAQMLDIPLRTFMDKIKRHGIK